MALQTRGFSVSQSPRAPAIPRNIGSVDVNEIVAGVKRGLEGFEAVRRAPRSMILADAQMNAGIAEAPLGTRRLTAETLATEQQLPYKTAILAAEASPGMLEAKRQALLNRSAKQASGDVQLATALANAQLRLQEDPNDAQAALIVSSLKPIADRKGMAPIEAQNQRAADVNATRIATTADTNETRRGIADANLASAEARAAAANALRADLHAKGLSQSEVNTRLAAEGRIEAARAANTNKAYIQAAEQNQQLHSALSSLALLENKADQYLATSMGSGPIVGSDPALWVRAVFGDTAGQELKAAIGQEMTNAVKTVQGLGAMSNIEFGAVMDQLPKTTDQGPAMVTKLQYLKAVRPWLAARSDLFLSEIEKGTPAMSAYEKVRAAFPVPPVPGAAAPTPASNAPPAPATAPTPGEFRIVEIK
jgi:hypothetical protein